MEIVKSKLTTRIVLFLTFTFLFGACAFAQKMNIERSINYNAYYKKDIVTKFPSYNLEFIDGRDTTFLSIFADSISNNRFGVRLYAFYPKKTDLSNSIIKLGFEDGSEDYIKAFEVDKENRYVEYALLQDVFNKLYKLKVTSVKFNYNNKSNKVNDSLFFFAFLSRYND